MRIVLKILILMYLVNSGFAFTIYIPQDYPTIQEGIYYLSNGDTLKVAPGTYERFLYSGNSLQNIHIHGSGALGDSISRIVGDYNGYGVFFDDAVNWEVSGFEILHFYWAICLEFSQDIELSHNYIHDNPYDHCCGILMEGCSDIYIHHNLLTDNEYVSIYVNDGCDTVSIVNNTVLYTLTYHGVMCLSYVSGFELINNIIAFNDGDGIQYVPGAYQGDAILEYNDNYGNGGSNWHNCTPGIGNISRDPIFTNTAPFYYDLQPNSPCIDAGDPNSSLDPDGTRADIGAFYFDQRPPLIEDLTVSVSDSNIVLNWDDIPGAIVYYIYKSDQSYFEIFGMTPADSVLTSEYIDWSIPVQEKYFYRVSSANNN